MRRPVLIAIIAAAAIIAVVLAIILVRQSQPGPGPVDIAAIGGPFTLVGEDGTPFTDADLLGRPTALFFGFTHCPDVCPTTLARFAALMDELGPAADDMNFVFVSVDADRDGPEEMARYTSSFDDRIIGLSGSPEQIATIAAEYRVFYEKIPTADGDYTMNHTATTYLSDRNGLFRSTIAYMENPDISLQKLQLMFEH